MGRDGVGARAGGGEERARRPGGVEKERKGDIASAAVCERRCVCGSNNEVSE